MDKNAIKKYAVWARIELITRVSQRAEKFDITADADVNASSVNGVLLTDAEKKQRKALIEQVKHKGFNQVMEEVAYTWFNRFIALRFMEVNGYLPSHIRVFTDDNNNFKPQILAEAIHLELDGLDMEKVYEMKNNNDNDELYKYLIITQCNDLSKILPGMFQKIADYTELLFPDNILREGSVIEQMITLISEDDWKYQVQMIGWLYQYYNTEPKANVFAKKGKVEKQEIPAATQLFTPDWVVHYMVENSLGHLWQEGHPNDELKQKWKYYLNEAKQEAIQKDIEDIKNFYSSIKPEDIRVIDPCQGSGHILCVLFDVLVDIYEDYGYSAKEAALTIVEKNIWGLDIDDRAAQLAYFSVMMKARQYDRRFFSRGIQPNVYSVKESNYIDKNAIDYFVNGNDALKESVSLLLNRLFDAKEYGSILSVEDVDFSIIYERFNEIENEPEQNIYTTLIFDQLLPVVKSAEALSQKYHIVITNPPYMAVSNADSKLKEYVNEHFIGGKTDLFSVFIEKCIDMTRAKGFTAMITMQSWLFLTSFEKVRDKVLNYEMVNMAHLGARGFDDISGEVVQTVAFSLQKMNCNGKYIGSYSRLIDGKSEAEKEKDFLSKDFIYYASTDKFLKLPQHIIAYWVSDDTVRCFDHPTLSKVFTTREGMATADNNRFLRLWPEVDINKITFDCESTEDGLNKKIKWVPYNKGGMERDWYGNNDYVVDWNNDGYEIKHNIDAKTGRIRSHNYNGEYGFREGITWSAISSGDLSVRYCSQGFLFDSKGAKGFSSNRDDLLWILGLLNSKVAMQFLQFISPTLDFKVGDVVSLPYIISNDNKEKIVEIVKNLIALSKDDWDSSEMSWDFSKYPLIPKSFEGSGKITIKQLCEKWEQENNLRIEKILDFETQLNKLFIGIYGLNEELDSEVKDITAVRNYSRKDMIKGLISYAVGCMFGRYALDKEGIVFAGGDWKECYKSEVYKPDVDNIIPICDDEYFPDDIVTRFVEFIRVVYGEDNLEENLNYIAEILGGKGLARDVIRSYFLNDFYADHCSQYSVTGSGKRPIYWLFDSGKKDGFKCLIYVHRYQPDTIARIRTGYVHELQSRYRTAIESIENRALNASGSEKVKLEKKLKHIKDQEVEIHEYEEKIHHLADQMISIDLDDGVISNYAKFNDVMATIK